MILRREIKLTDDGSKTLFIPDWNENYHSSHGAVQEAKHVFLKYGLGAIEDKTEINVFEVGFGTGLNAILTYQYAIENLLKIYYNSIEAYPITKEEMELLDYVSLFENKDTKEVYHNMYDASWNESVMISESFHLKKIHNKLEHHILPQNHYDIIFFDAFGPRVQEGMWSKDHFQNLYNSLKKGGLFVTYCAKGQVKRDLKAVGFTVETLPGPPGKREMTRGRKSNL
jgi:tRNA U34 5-methylaminomethyl-2-thiouridine-forming methyltransferase MnmC